MTFGQAVRLIRTSANETQKDMADVLGITQVHLSNVENDKSMPSPALMAAVRKYYGFCPMALVVFSDEKLNITRHRMLLGFNDVG